MSLNSPLPQRQVENFPRFREPVMRVNNYDRVSAWLISAVLALVLVVIVMVSWWLSTRPVHEEFLVPMEMIRSPGGSPDGVEGETLRVESPDDPSPDAAAGETPLEGNVGSGAPGVVEFSESGMQQQIQEFVTAPDFSGGRPGSAHGTGRRALGLGDGDGGFPADQRWFISFSDEASMTEYARQLDFFKLELGALLPTGEMVYLSHFTAPQPTKRTTTSGKDEKRLYMTWQGGERKSADVKLFANAGIDASRAVLFQFYPPELEQKLLTKEYQYRKRKSAEIRRTYFNVTKAENGYDFVVTRQTYLK